MTCPGHEISNKRSLLGTDDASLRRLLRHQCISQNPEQISMLKFAVIPKIFRCTRKRLFNFADNRCLKSRDSNRSVARSESVSKPTYKGSCYFNEILKCLHSLLISLDERLENVWHRCFSNVMKSRTLARHCS